MSMEIPVWWEFFRKTVEKWARTKIRIVNPHKRGRKAWKKQTALKRLNQKPQKGVRKERKKETPAEEYLPMEKNTMVWWTKRYKLILHSHSSPRPWVGRKRTGNSFWATKLSMMLRDIIPSWSAIWRRGEKTRSDRLCGITTSRKRQWSSWGAGWRKITLPNTKEGI